MSLGADEQDRHVVRIVAAMDGLDRDDKTIILIRTIALLNIEAPGPVIRTIADRLAKECAVLD